MEKEITFTLKIGGLYSIMERKYQVLLMIDGREPKLFSNDNSLEKAIDSATNYIKMIYGN